jgi:hypothetical protein
VNAHNLTITHNLNYEHMYCVLLIILAREVCGAMGLNYMSVGMWFELLGLVIYMDKFHDLSCLLL